MSASNTKENCNEISFAFRLPIYLKTLHSTCSKPPILSSSAIMDSIKSFWACIQPHKRLSDLNFSPIMTHTMTCNGDT